MTEGTRAGHVIVVGSIGGDVVVTVDQHPHAGETVMGSHLGHFPGGKGANQAVAAARAGAMTRMVGRVGTDDAGNRQRTFLTSHGIDIDGVTSMSTVPTQTAIISVDAHGENRIVVVSGASGCVDATDIAGMQFEPGDIVVSQFEVPQSAIRAAFTSAKLRGATTILNCAPAAFPEQNLLKLVDVLIVNETEAAFLMKSNTTEQTPLGTPLEIAQKLAVSFEQTVILTLGEDGVVAFGPGGPFSFPGHDVTVVDTTGAGDCFVGYVAAGLAAHMSLEDTLLLANRAASLCVQVMGAGPSIPSRDAVEVYVTNARTPVFASSSHAHRP